MFVPVFFLGATIPRRLNSSQQSYHQVPGILYVVRGHKVGSNTSAYVYVHVACACCMLCVHVACACACACVALCVRVCTLRVNYYRICLRGHCSSYPCAVQLLAEAASGAVAWRATMQLDKALARRTVFRLVRYAAAIGSV